jgi:hypothetical protein
MTTTEVEALPEVIEATRVLQRLEARGLVEPVIASGWTRAKLTGGHTKDIDVSYVGPVHYKEAQVMLREVLDEFGYDPAPWDIDGIWNAEMSYGVTHSVDNLLLYYVDSVDSIYLASDGRLHDPTGFGFADVQAKILRVNPYDTQNGRQPTPSEDVNVCLEACRRVAKFNHMPTPESVTRMKAGVANWDKLTDMEKTYFVRKLASKFTPHERPKMQKIYQTYGWGFVFDIPQVDAQQA